MSCACDAWPRLECLEVPRTQVTHPSHSLNSAKRRGELAICKGVRGDVNLHFFKKGDPDDPLPLIMRCIRVDTAAGDFHIKSRSQSCFWPPPVSHGLSPVPRRDAEDQHPCIPVHPPRDASSGRKDLCCGAVRR